MRCPPILLALLLLPAACAGRPGPVGPAVPVAESVPEPGWRGIIKIDDRRQLDALAQTWRAARAVAERRARADLATEGALLQADAGLQHPTLVPGAYRCRLIRLGSAASRRGIRVFPSFFCNVGGDQADQLSFIKQTGSDLPAGWLYQQDERRYVFLGARQAREGDTSIEYGAERARDVVGVVERIGPFRWRMAIPSGTAGLDVYEIVPVPVEQQSS